MFAFNITVFYFYKICSNEIAVAGNHTDIKMASNGNDGLVRVFCIGLSKKSTSAVFYFDSFFSFGHPVG